MFEEVFGIPAHPLLVHAAVVFVPLQILAAFAYALVPRVRRLIAWLVIALAVIAPIATAFSKLSGDAFRDRLVSGGKVGADYIPLIDQHQEWGTRTLYATITLSVLMVLLMIVQVSRSRPVAAPDSEAATPVVGARGKGSVVIAAILTIAVLAVGAVNGFLIFKTGDTGAHMVWNGF